MAYENKGWNEFDVGSLLFSFERTAKMQNIAETPQDERPYSETNSYNASVADWRVQKPILNKEYCIDCQNCWIYCPDISIISKDKKMVGIDYDHCKGCGICVEVCPTNPKSLLMFDEQVTEETALSQWPQKKSKKGEK